MSFLVPPENDPNKTAPAPDAGAKPAAEETPEAKRARLQAELAELGPAESDAGDKHEVEGTFGTAEAPPKLPVQVDESGHPITPQGATKDSVQEMLRAFMDEQRSWRSKVIQEVRASKVPAAPTSIAGETPDDRKRARDQAIKDAPYYDPISGRLHQYLCESTGYPDAPHPPVMVVPTDELHNEPDPRDKQAYADWQAGHTAAPDHEQLIQAARAR